MVDWLSLANQEDAYINLLGAYSELKLTCQVAMKDVLECREHGHMERNMAHDGGSSDEF